MLCEVGKQRTREARGEDIRYVGITPDTLDEMGPDAPALYKEGCDYYRSERAFCSNAPSRMPFASFNYLCSFNAFEFMETVSPRPILLIVGSEADTLYFSQAVYEKAREPKEPYLIGGNTHRFV